MKRLLSLLAMVAVLIAMAAPAIAAIKIERINFNPHGRDSGRNGHLNKEKVVIVNDGSEAVQLDGWALFDRGRAQVYTFDRLRLRPGDHIWVMSGRGQDVVGGCVDCNNTSETYFLHWDLDSYVWRNGGDRATLQRPNQQVVDQCRYTLADSSPHRC